jgi:hypothetical protein
MTSVISSSGKQEQGSSRSTTKNEDIEDAATIYSKNENGEVIWCVKSLFHICQL